MNTEVKNQIQEMSLTLDSMIKVYRHLLSTVRKEKEILIDARLDDLNVNNLDKEKTLFKLKQLEGQRIEQTRNLATLENMKDPNAKLLDLAVFYQNEVGEKFRKYHSVLVLLLQRIQMYNIENETLVQAALHNVTGAMNSIKDSLKPKTTYEKQGQVNKGSEIGAQFISKQV